PENAVKGRAHLVTHRREKMHLVFAGWRLIARLGVRVAVRRDRASDIKPFAVRQDAFLPIEDAIAFDAPGLGPIEGRRPRGGGALAGGEGAVAPFFSRGAEKGRKRPADEKNPIVAVAQRDKVT